mgnify:CR=1 FL=1
MTRFLIPILAGFALTACGQSPAVSTADAAAPSAAAPSPALPTPAMTVEDSCRQAVEILYGQSGDAVTFDESDFSISWPAPVDGGRLTFACSFVGSKVTLSNGGQTRTVDLSSPADTPAQQEAAS